MLARSRSKKTLLMTGVILSFLIFLPSYALSQFAYTLTVSKSGSGTGTVTSDITGINCDAGNTDCTEDYFPGTVVTLTATASTGSTFTQWSGACSGSGNTCIVTMDAVKDVTARFNLPTNVSGTISANTTWTLANSPYYVTGDVIVWNGVNLTIEAGVIVKFAQFTRLAVNGTLDAVGSSGNPITFTGTSATLGWWNRIDVRSGGSALLDNCIVQYAGYGSINGSIYKTGTGNLTITNSAIGNSGSYGIYLDNTTATGTLGSNTIQNNASHGIYLINAGNGFTINGSNTISNNGGYGIYMV
ncbi:MAG: right-handed parallel beta-helix repeat-containing protein, partial [Nitrospiraceae bacterium]